MRRLARSWSGFAEWRKKRPFVGGLLTMIAGVEMFFSGQLDIGKIHVQLGIEGFQATIIPVLLVVLGLLAMLMPVHRIFYGVISLVVSVYSLIGVNLGGFFLGMLLGAVGGVLVVSWMPKVGRRAAVGSNDLDAGSTDDAARVQEPVTETPLAKTPVEPLPLVLRRP
jgi:hypothetical protein